MSDLLDVHTRTPLVNRIFRVSLYVFAGSIVFSVIGMTLLNHFPVQAGVALGYIAQYTGLSLPSLIKGPTWVYMALLPVLSFLLYLEHLGARRSLLFLLWGSAIGAAAELIGTQTGFPFGHYEYREWLGAKIFGHVPWFIPPSWYAMSIISYDLARRLRGSAVYTIVMASVFMVLWDVALDPAMNKAFPFWAYRADGIFFGMPIVNWLGWMLTSLVIMWGYQRLLGDLKHEAPPAVIVYALNTIFPILISLLYGLPLAAAIGTIALAIPLTMLWRRGALRPRTPVSA
jgi:carotene biosynthesis associated membrane protein